MTVGKSLVEDMARALDPKVLEAGVREAEVAGGYGYTTREYVAAIYTAMETARLSVLTDRLPADDRELLADLEFLFPNMDGVFGDREVIYGEVARRAADRITAYSASRDETDAE